MAPAWSRSSRATAPRWHSSTSSNLSPDDRDGAADVYVKDLASGALTLASTATSGAKSNGESVGTVAMSATGNTVAFASTATNLAANDAQPDADVYVKDLQAGTLSLASTTADSAVGNRGDDSPSLTADGRTVAFHSLSTNLDPNDTETSEEFGDSIYIKDLDTGHLSFVTHGQASEPALSSDGSLLAFTNGVTEEVPSDDNGSDDVYLRDLRSGSVRAVSTTDVGQLSNQTSAEPALSADGSTVAFTSFATNLLAGVTVPAAYVRTTDTLLTAAAKPLTVAPAVAPARAARARDSGAATAAASTPPYFTILFGRSMFTTLADGGTCPNYNDAATTDILEAATALKNRTKPLKASGNVVIDRTTNTRHCESNFIYTSWPDLASLRDTYGWQQVSASQTYDGWKNLPATSNPQGARTESCGSLPELEGHAHNRAWGLFAFPSTDVKYTDVVYSCFGYGRRYGSLVNQRTSTNLTKVTYSINGGARGDYDLPSTVKPLLAGLGSDGWFILQPYRFRVGAGAESGNRTWDCTGAPSENHTATAEEYCWVDFLDMLSAVPAAAVNTDPASVACHWGRDRPGQPGWCFTHAAELDN